MNIVLNAAYLLGTAALFAKYFGPLLVAWMTEGKLVEWSKQAESVRQV